MNQPQSVFEAGFRKYAEDNFQLTPEAAEQAWQEFVQVGACDAFLKQAGKGKAVVEGAKGALKGVSEMAGKGLTKAKEIGGQAVDVARKNPISTTGVAAATGVGTGAAVQHQIEKPAPTPGQLLAEKVKALLGR